MNSRHRRTRTAWLALLVVTLATLPAVFRTPVTAQLAPGERSDAQLVWAAPAIQPIQPLAAQPAGTADPSLAPFYQAAGGPALRFDHLSLADGLSQSVVVDSLQDDLGFMWFATQDGLNRYDGAQFVVHRSAPQDPNRLSHNFIQSIDQDSAGVIWIGTNAGGLNCYDPRSGRFTRYLHDPLDPNSLSENSIATVLVDAQDQVWAGTSNSGVNRLDPRTGAVQRFQHDPDDPSSLSSNAVSYLWEDAAGELWVGTFLAGLNRLERSTGKFQRFQHAVDDPSSLSSDKVQTIYSDRQGTLWIGTQDTGLNRFVPETGGFAHYAPDPGGPDAGDPDSLSTAWVFSLYEDRRGNLWVGTNGQGLYRLDHQAERFWHYRHDPGDPHSPVSDSVWSIYEDRSGVLWLGTFGSGVDRYDPYRDKFLSIRAGPGRPPTLSSNSLWGIYEDLQGVLWIGSEGGGLNRFDPQTGEWQYYRAGPAETGQLASDVVFTIYQDRAGVYWVATNQGLHRFDPQTERFERYPTPPFVFAIYEDHTGLFWLGTTEGLVLLDRETRALRKYQTHPGDPATISSDAVSVLVEDQQGQLWAGTLNGGLNRFDRETGTFTRFVSDPADPASLSDNAILSIYPDAGGFFWVGTSGGLNRFDPRTGQATAYRAKDGLPNDVVYGILADEQGHLWLSTNRGLARFNLQTLEFKNYAETDGLQGNEFNQWSYCKTRSGLMLFGGVNGLNVFNPNRIQDNPFIPPVVITGFEVFHKPLQPGPGAPLQQPVEASQEIRLAYTDDFFEIQYAALHFSAPEENQYAYIMEGLDKDWNMVGNRRFATYTYIRPGNYTFRVKGTNSDGVWNEAGAALKISIPPPFWQTAWFRLLVLAGVVSSAAGAVALRFRAIEGRRRQLEILVDERTRALRATMVELERAREAAEAASRAKSVFLANMSHEFRTPLNAILGFTQVLRRDGRLDSGQMESIEIVQRSSEHLLGLINDVLEMSKIEAGRTVLKRRNFDLHRMLEGLEEMFALRAENKGIALELELDRAVPRYIHSDEGKLRQVLMNLLGNAVKFTQHGQVTLRVYPGRHPVEPDGHLVWIAWEVEDTGPGISAAELEQIFVPFVQSASGQEAQEGTGLGLSISQQYVRLMQGEIQVRSEPGRGSCFTFELPVEVVEPSELDYPTLTRRVVGLAAGQPVYRLLAVDDQEVNRMLLHRLFGPLGFEVREAANGQEALEIWEQWQPHLIWMDMRMPVMNGYEATRRIKASTRGQATIIIALTASGLEEERQVILSEGCDDYLRKPFHEQDLFDAVARHLGVRYVYEAIPPAGSAGGLAESGGPGATPEDGEATLAQRLALATPEWITELERATILGDQEAITQLANAIVGQDPALASSLVALAQKFDHDRILTAIQKARETHADTANG